MEKKIVVPQDFRGKAGNRIGTLGGWLVAVAALAAMLGASAVADAGDFPAVVRRVDNFNASGTIRSVSVKNISGDVKFVSGSSFSAAIEVVVRARTPKKAQEVLGKTVVWFNNDNGALCLVTRPAGTKGTLRTGSSEGGCREDWSYFQDSDDYSIDANYVVTVPPGVERHASVVNGEIRSAGSNAGLELSSVNGSIEVSAGRGSANLHTVNGRIEASYAALPRGTALEADTVNGAIVLSLPENAAFDFSAHAMSGDIVSSFALPALASSLDFDEERLDSIEERSERREKVRRKKIRVRREADEERQASGKAKGKAEASADVEIEIDLSDLEDSLEEMAEDLEDLEEASADIAREMAMNFHHAYATKVHGGGASVKLSTLNGRIALLAAGTSEAQAKPLLAASGGKRVIVSPKVKIRAPLPPHPPSTPRSPRTPGHPPLPPAAPGAPLPPGDGEEDGGEEDGDLNLGNVEGDFISNLPVGNVRIGKVSGTVRITVPAGDIQIGSAGAGADLKTRGGDIRVDSVSGDVKCKSFGGDLHVGSASGDARLETLGGDISLETGARGVEAKTAGGDITVKRVRGPVKLETGGGEVFCAVAGAEPGAAVSIASAGGDVTLVLPSNYKASVEIEVDGVDDEGASIVSEFPGVKVSKQSLGSGDSRGSQSARGDINGGGAKVVIRATSGMVSLKKGPATP